MGGRVNGVIWASGIGDRRPHIDPKMLLLTSVMLPKGPEKAGAFNWVCSTLRERYAQLEVFTTTGILSETYAVVVRMKGSHKYQSLTSQAQVAVINIAIFLH